MDYDKTAHSLQCPKCGHGMTEVSHEDIEIDRCTNCSGIWFDDDEVHALKAKAGSEALDSGDAKEGWKWDSRTDINCPHCGKKMENSADSSQNHIWYEMCPDHGIFMDAGEFSDFKEENLLDWFRGIVKGRRGKVAP
jgi:Zn-finger nucleic acid-binding protein